jgi:hypothetical protein
MSSIPSSFSDLDDKMVKSRRALGCQAAGRRDANDFHVEIAGHGTAMCWLDVAEPISCFDGGTLIAGAWHGI